MADELDRTMLEMLAAGETYKAVAEATGQKEANVRQRKGFYVKESIYDPEMRAVDWPQFEVADPPKRRGAGPKRRKTGRSTSTPSRPKPAVQDRAPTPTPAKPKAVTIFTAEEIEVLKAIATERIQAADSPRSHTPVDKPTSVRPDGGLWAALRGWADREKVSYTEAINRSIEALLR